MGAMDMEKHSKTTCFQAMVVSFFLGQQQIDFLFIYCVLSWNGISTNSFRIHSPFLVCSGSGYRFFHCVSMLCFSVVALAVVSELPQLRNGYKSPWNAFAHRGCPQPVLHPPKSEKAFDRVLSREHSRLIFPDESMKCLFRLGMPPTCPSAPLPSRRKHFIETFPGNIARWFWFYFVIYKDQVCLCLFRLSPWMQKKQTGRECIQLILFKCFQPLVVKCFPGRISKMKTKKGSNHIVLLFPITRKANSLRNGNMLRKMNSP